MVVAVFWRNVNYATGGVGFGLRCKNLSVCMNLPPTYEERELGG